MAINRTGPQLTDKNRLIAVTNRLNPKYILINIIVSYSSFKISLKTLNLVKNWHIYNLQLANLTYSHYRLGSPVDRSRWPLSSLCWCKNPCYIYHFRSALSQGPLTRDLFVFCCVSALCTSAHAENLQLNWKSYIVHAHFPTTSGLVFFYLFCMRGMLKSL